MGDFYLKTDTARSYDFSSEQQYSLHVHRYRNFHSVHIHSHFSIDIYLPPDYDASGSGKFPVLFFNDGQDMKAVRLMEVLLQLYAAQQIPSVIVVAVHAGERLQEYGTAHQADYRNRGTKAKLYTHFIVHELIPFLRNKYHTRPEPHHNVFAGFSLGGLSAMDIVWNHPNIFGKAGVFSGSFWWRHSDYCKADPDGGRIMHELLSRSQHRPGLKFWFQTGTMDETEDRNNNGVIDAIDDTLDVIHILKKLGYHHKHDIRYREVKNGTHHPSTWANVLPDFLVWAFGK